jgi:ATP-dependent DNA helicase RecG
LNAPAALLSTVRHRPKIFPLKLMERRGSGLRKIIDEYPEGVAPAFRSTEQSFVVTLKNLNHGKLSMPSGIDNGIENNAHKILSALADDPKIIQKRLSEFTGMSVRTVARELKNLRDAGMVHHIGSDRTGCWEIVG